MTDFTTLQEFKRVARELLLYVDQLETMDEKVEVTAQAILAGHRGALTHVRRLLEEMAVEHDKRAAEGPFREQRDSHTSKAEALRLVVKSLEY